MIGFDGEKMRSPSIQSCFFKSIIDNKLVIPFTYEKNSFFYARCIACEESYDPKSTNVYGVIADEWSALSHHMQSMLGRVERVYGSTCVMVRWDNQVAIHVPNTAVRRYFHSSEKISENSSMV